MQFLARSQFHCITVRLDRAGSRCLLYPKAVATAIRDHCSSDVSCSSSRANTSGVVIATTIVTTNNTIATNIVSVPRVLEMEKGFVMALEYMITDCHLCFVTTFKKSKK